MTTKPIGPSRVCGLYLSDEATDQLGYLMMVAGRNDNLAEINRLIGELRDHGLVVARGEACALPSYVHQPVVVMAPEDSDAFSAYSTKYANGGVVWFYDDQGKICMHQRVARCWTLGDSYRCNCYGGPWLRWALQ